MSIVLGFATKAEAIIMSDGRVLDNNTKEIISENCNKTHRINQNVILGHSGIKEINEHVIQNFYQIYGTRISTVNADEVTHILCDISKQLIHSLSQPFPLQMIIAGIDENHNITLNAFSKSEEFQIRKMVPDSRSCSYMSLDPDSIAGKNIYSQFLANGNLTFREKMINCITYVSTIDPTVNSTIYELSVKK